MKKFMFSIVCFIAISFASLNLIAQSEERTMPTPMPEYSDPQKTAVNHGLVVLTFEETANSLDEYSEVETAAANLWQRSLPLNDLEDENLIFPGSTLVFAFPEGEDRFLYPVKKGDEGLKISKNLITGNYSYEDNSGKMPELPQIMPVKEVINPEIEYSSFDWMTSFLILCLVAIFLLVAAIKFYNSWTDTKKNKEYEQYENQNLRNKNIRLEDKIKEMEKKMPIEAPATVNEEWLKNNHPVNSAVENLDQLVFSGVKELGQKPDLIAHVMVSTAGKSIVMDFSFGRKAQTGLTNVPVYLGWNWNTEKNDWTEVGMIATICSNGFQVSPEKVVPMTELFTKFDLVSLDERPIVYESDAVKDCKYPALIRPLMLKYHNKNISDLNRSGAVVIPKGLAKEVVN